MSNGRTTITQMTQMILYERFPACEVCHPLSCTRHILNIQFNNILHGRGIHYHIVQAGTEIRPASYSVDTGVLSRGLSGRMVRLNTHLHLVSRLIMSWAIAAFPLYAFMVCIWAHSLLTSASCSGFHKHIAFVTIYTNIKYQSKHNHLLCKYYLWATCFDSLESSSGPTKNRSKVI